MGCPCHLTQTDHKASKFPVSPPHVPADDTVLQPWQSVLQEVTPNNPFGGPLAVQRGRDVKSLDLQCLIPSHSRAHGACSRPDVTVIIQAGFLHDPDWRISPPDFWNEPKI